MKQVRYICVLIILVCMLLFSSCTQSNQGHIQMPDNSTDDTISGQKETQESTDTNDSPSQMDGTTDSADNADSDDSMPSKPADTSGNEENNNDTASSKADAFSWNDMTFEGEPFLPIRPTTREELDTAFGEPIRVERIDAVNHTIFWEERQYDGILITCEEWDETDYAVGTIEYQRKDLSYVRGVHVGDSMEDVMGVFRNDATDFTPKDTDAGCGVVLYGTPRHMADYGILLYENDKPSQLMYQSQGGGIRLTLDDEGIVVSIEMFGGLH